MPSGRPFLGWYRLYRIVDFSAQLTCKPTRQRPPRAPVLWDGSAPAPFHGLQNAYGSHLAKYRLAGILAVGLAYASVAISTWRRICFIGP